MTTSWKDVQKFSPLRLATTPARPALSESVISDPGRDKRQLLKEGVDIFSNLLPQKLGGLGAMGLAGIIKKAGGAWNPKTLERLAESMKPQPVVDSLTREIYEGFKGTPEGQAYLQKWMSNMRDANNPNLEELEALINYDTNPVIQARNFLVDKRIIPYVRGHMGAESDPIRKLLETTPDRKFELYETKQKQLTSAKEQMAKLAQQRGVAPEILTRSQMRVTQLEKDLAEIKELGKLPEIGDSELHMDLRQKREAYGKQFNDEGQPFPILAKSTPARQWEYGVDENVFTNKAKVEGTEKFEPVHEFSQSSYAPNQLRHMLDEIYGSMRPESDLPDRLRLTIDQAKNLSLPQMYQHADAINAYRRALQAEADAAMANSPAVHPFMDFPDDPKGMRWVELKNPAPKELDVPVDKAEEYYASLPVGERDKWVADWRRRRDGVPTELPSTMEIVEEGGGWKYRLKKPDNYGSQRTSPPFNSQEEALRYALDTPMARNAALQEQLTYEGKQLAHCVGNYCEPVAEGRTRILSLRDAKNKPLATVELQKYDPEKLAYNHDFWARPDVIEATRGLDPTSEEFNKIVDQLAGKDDQWKVNQIKGYNNATEYGEDILPYIQQLLKREKLPVVDDFKGTKLFDLKAFEDRQNWSHPFPIRDVSEMPKISSKYGTPQEVLGALKQAYPEDRYITHDEFRKVFGLDD